MHSTIDTARFMSDGHVTAVPCQVPTGASTFKLRDCSDWVLRLGVTSLVARETVQAE